MRRAGLPVAFSQGFHPHPLFSFAAPLPVGIAGENEYLELELEKNIPTKEILSRLSLVFPEGIQIKEIWPVNDDPPSLMAALEKASYKVEIELSRVLTEEELKRLIRSFLALDLIEVTRKKKDRFHKRNIRPGILSLQGRVKGEKMILEMELQAGSTGNVRPEEVLESFLKKNELFVFFETGTIKRMGLFFKN
jgi:radical SAM-linked protein